MAPELHLVSLKKSDYDEKAGDCWSLGVVLHCLLTNRCPFSMSSEKYREIKNETDATDRVNLIKEFFTLRKIESTFLDITN